MTAEKVIQYYEQCHTDYRLVWRVDDTCAIHYGYYDENAKRHKAAVVNMVKVLCDTAKIKQTDKVLDAGCGVGGTAIWIAQNIGSEVIGINISTSQLQLAEKNAEKRSVQDKVSFQQEDFTDTHFPSASFDVVMFVESGCYAENKMDIIKESMRLLKPGGRLVVADGFMTKGVLSDKESTEMKKWLDGWAVPNLAEVNVFKKYLEKTGFSDVTYRDISENVMPSSKGMFRAGIISYPIGKLMEIMHLRTHTQTQNIVATYYQHTTLRKELWQYGIFSCRKPKKKL